MTLLHLIRRRVIWLCIGLAFATLAVISWTALPAIPIVAGGVAVLAIALNTMTSRLRETACMGCGASIADLPHGEHGVICPSCGHISSRMHLNDDGRPLLSDHPQQAEDAPEEGPIPPAAPPIA